MSSWRDQILKEFTPKVIRLTLVADPDGLLLEEGILAGIRERGFELIPFDDPVAFRYAYESRFRSRWDHGEHTDLVVVLRSQTSDLDGLPYDLLQAGRRLSFNLGDIFPNLSYPVVAALDRGDLDALYEAQKRHAPGHLGENASMEFVLRHVFEIATELIKKPTDLLHVLLRRHYRGQRIPPVLDKRFIQLLRQNTLFDDWPIEMLAKDREAFFLFLQERWPIFLDRQAAAMSSRIRDRANHNSLSIEGPVELLFDHPDIRVYIDNLFLEGILLSVAHEHSDTLAKTWVGVGLRTHTVEDRIRRLSKLIDSLQASLPSENAKHTEWFHFARRWAEMIFLMNDQAKDMPNALGERVKHLQKQVDVIFSAWLSKRYAGLVNLPPSPPVMLHHLPRFLTRQLEDGRSRVALILVDGLAMDQWLVIREGLVSRQSNLFFREQAVFAWVPSLTSVSRQAAFAGKAPVFFPNSIQTTNREAVLWAQFWADQGLTEREVAYIRGLGDGNLDDVATAIAHPMIKVIGLIVDKVDKIMHGMELGTAGMHNQVSQWAGQSSLGDLLSLLLDRGFSVYLTSDHGNIEAEGCGCPSEGAVADLRGERVRIYPDAALRGRVKERFPGAVDWEPVGLPNNYFALLAPSRQAFVQEKKRIVCHGGVSIEELVVPLIQIERRSE